MNQSDLVLVTGGSGFIASNCIAVLLRQGYRVKTTLRSLDRIPHVKQMLSVAGITNFNELSFVQADLAEEQGWINAVAGCRYVIHPASPTPKPDNKNEDDFIIPAVNGVMFVLRAAKSAGVQRVVLTSAFGAVCFGTNKQTPYTEADWTDLTKDVPAYQKSKTLAEKAAWNYVNGEGKGLELACVNPTGVLGPVFDADYTHSIQAIHQMLNGEIKALPKILASYVDVRDVADLHLKAMLDPKANGERFLAVAGSALSMREIASILHSEFGAKASKVPTKELPNWLIRLLSLFIPKLKLVVPHLGLTKEASHKKATDVLGWKPRSNREAVIASAESLIRLGLVK